jgi:hypothetical protein
MEPGGALLELRKRNQDLRAGWARQPQCDGSAAGDAGLAEQNMNDAVLTRTGHICSGDPAWRTKPGELHDGPVQLVSGTCELRKAGQRLIRLRVDRCHPAHRVTS